MRGWSITVIVALVIAGWLLVGRRLQARLESRRESDLAQLCQTRFQRLALALQNYLRDYENVLPPAPTWMDALQTAVPPSQRDLIFRCPKLTRRDAFGYAFNAEAWLAQWKAPRWLPEMYPPEKVVLIYETRRKGRNLTGTGDDVPEPGRHTGRNFYLFADFTAMAISPEEAKKMMERGDLLFRPLPLPRQKTP